MNYLLWINDMVVIENGEEYDFLYEMYPEIKDEFSLIWSITNKAEKPISGIAKEKIDKINSDIERQFQILGAPTYILFKQQGHKLVEPFSEVEFTISPKCLNLRLASIEEVERYTDELTEENREFLRTKLTQFKQKTIKKPKRK
ncbi:MAG: hypothetical protein E7157_02465 [Lactobacillales bacterium]|nr:hypothetical protein [Lactobacillales bacterium]